MSHVIKLPIVQQKTIAQKTNEISFGLSGQEFAFEAGQYIQVALPELLYPDHKGASRVFSINSSPNDKEKIAIAFRDSGSGFKRTLMELPLGTLIDVEGPFGFFMLPRNTVQSVVFIAGGIGITPCISMIRFADGTKRSGQITLFYANRDKGSAAYLNELEAIAGRNSNFVLKNKFGRIDADFIQNSIPDINQPIWYIVGPPPMVAAMRDVLFRLGIDEGKIRFEEFTGYE
jgi:ferredoxin-NADP reductase